MSTPQPPDPLQRRPGESRTQYQRRLNRVRHKTPRPPANGDLAKAEGVRQPMRPVVSAETVGDSIRWSPGRSITDNAPEARTRKTERQERKTAAAIDADTATELGVLGSLMLDHSSLAKLNGRLDAADFESEMNRWIYQAICDAVEDCGNAETVSVLAQLEKSNRAALAGGLAYLNDLAGNSLRLSNIIGHADRIRASAEKRRLRDSLHAAANAADRGDPEAADAHLRAAEKHRHGDASPGAARGYTFADGCRAPIGSTYVVKRVVEPGCLTIWYGDSGTLKSFIVTDLGAHVGARLERWHGVRVHGCGVLVVLGEGQGGYAKRLRAWAKVKKIDDPTSVKVYVYPRAVDLNSGPGDLAAAIQEAETALGCTVVLVLVDTFSTNLGDGDEQSNSDAGRVFDNTRLAAGPDRAAGFVHHVGHIEKKRERGAYQIRANVDFSFLLERDDRILTLTNVKAKDADLLDPMAFTFHTVELGTDEDGDQMTSLVITAAEQPAQARKRDLRAKPKGKNQALVLQAIEASINLHGRHPLGVDFRKAVKAVTLDQARAEFDRKAGHIESKHRAPRFTEAVSGLKAAGRLDGLNEWLWIPE